MSESEDGEAQVELGDEAADNHPTDFGQGFCGPTPLPRSSGVQAKAKIVLVNADAIDIGRTAVRDALKEFVYSVFGEGHYGDVDQMSDGEIRSFVNRLFTDSKKGFSLGFIEFPEEPSGK
jgi:hypothetical protein